MTIGNTIKFFCLIPSLACILSLINISWQLPDNLLAPIYVLSAHVIIPILIICAIANDEKLDNDITLTDKMVSLLIIVAIEVAFLTATYLSTKADPYIAVSISLVIINFSRLSIYIAEIHEHTKAVLYSFLSWLLIVFISGIFYWVGGIAKKINASGESGSEIVGGDSAPMVSPDAIQSGLAAPFNITGNAYYDIVVFSIAMWLISIILEAIARCILSKESTSADKVG